MAEARIDELVMDAQADLQTALGLYRLDHGRGDTIEERLAQSLARLHLALDALGRPMYDPATHPRVPARQEQL